MTKTPPTPTEARTIAWFETEVQAHAQKSGLLDTASDGLLEIAEISGGLVGTWRRYRNQQQDLDITFISQSLGAFLAAIVRIANALDLSLESLMHQQILRSQTVPPVRERRTRQQTRRARMKPVSNAPSPGELRDSL